MYSSSERPHGGRTSFGLLLTAFVMLAASAFILMSASDDSSADGGTCGGDIEWRFADGLLVIEGNGSMDDYESAFDVPWSDHSEDIRMIVVSDGVSHIGTRAFRNCDNLEAFCIGSDLVSIGVPIFPDFYYYDEATSTGLECSANNLDGAVFVKSENLFVKQTVQGTAGVAWSFSGGVLSISGTGGMDEFYLKEDVPWYAYREMVLKATIADGVASIGRNAFYHCVNMTEAEVPDSVTSIGHEAFAECGKLGAVHLSSNLTTLGGAAFDYCSSIRTITIPDGVTMLWIDTLEGCTGLERVYFSSNLSAGTHIVGEVCNVDLYASDGTTELDTRYYDNIRGKAFVRTGGILVEQPASSTADGGISWFYSSGLLTFTGSGDMDDYSAVDHPPWWGYSDVITQIVISDGITSIGDYAFVDCGNLEAMYFGSALTDLGTAVFYDATFYDSDGTTPLTPTAEDLGGWAFVLSGDRFVKHAVEGTGNVGWSFSGGPSGGTLTVFGTGDMDDYISAADQPWGDYRGLITEISVSQGVTHIGDNAFAFSGNATSVLISPTVTSIGEDALSYTTRLESVSFPDSVTAIGDYAFRYSGLTAVDLPRIEAVGHGTFMYCIGLTSAVIPDTVARIGEEAFLGCINLRELYVSSGLTEMSPDSFTDVDLYDTDGETPMDMDVTHLRGTMFVEKSNRAVRLDVDLVVDGSVCSKASDTHSASLSFDDITYLKKRATLDPQVQLQIMLKDGIRALFDRAAIGAIGDTELTLTIMPVDKSELSGAVRDLIGDDPAYSIEFGGYNDLGDGRATITVPYEAGGTGIRASFISGESVSGTADCTCSDGRATFETSQLAMFFVGPERSPAPSGSGFPLWIPVIIVIAAVAAAGAFLFMRKKEF